MLYFLIFLLLSLWVSFLYAKPFSMRFLDLAALPLTMLNDAFPCTLLNTLWVQTITRHTRCLCDLGPMFMMLIPMDHQWLTSCNPIWIPLVSIWLSKICIQYCFKQHSSCKVYQILQLYILLLFYYTIGIWVNMLYLTNHLMNLSITINNC